MPERFSKPERRVECKKQPFAYDAPETPTQNFFAFLLLRLAPGTCFFVLRLSTIVIKMRSISRR